MPTALHGVSSEAPECHPPSYPVAPSPRGRPDSPGPCTLGPDPAPFSVTQDMHTTYVKPLTLPSPKQRAAFQACYSQGALNAMTLQTRTACVGSALGMGPSLPLPHQPEAERDDGEPTGSEGLLFPVVSPQEDEGPRVSTPTPGNHLTGLI